MLPVVAIWLLLPTAIAAAENRDAARTAFAEGTRYYDLTRFDLALESFQRAYWNYEEPALLFNIGQCQRQLGRKGEALAFYRSYLRKLPEAENRDEVVRLIHDLEAQVALERTPARPALVETSDRTLVAAPPRAAEPPRRRSLVHRPWFWVGVAGGAALVAGGVALGLVYGSTTHYPQPSVASVQGN